MTITADYYNLSVCGVCARVVSCVGVHTCFVWSQRACMGARGQPQVLTPTFRFETYSVYHRLPHELCWGLMGSLLPVSPCAIGVLGLFLGLSQHSAQNEWREGGKERQRERERQSQTDRQSMHTYIFISLFLKDDVYQTKG